MTSGPIPPLAPARLVVCTPAVSAAVVKTRSGNESSVRIDVLCTKRRTGGPTLTGRLGAAAFIPNESDD